MNRITLNGRLFVQGKRNVVNTLFEQGGTASGYYAVTSAGIQLFTAQGERIGGINAYGVLYQSGRLPDGRLFHQPVTPRLIGGLDAPYGKTRDEAHAALCAHGIQRR
jgi:hypothetical protein